MDGELIADGQEQPSHRRDAAPVARNAVSARPEPSEAFGRRAGRRSGSPGWSLLGWLRWRRETREFLERLDEQHQLILASLTDIRRRLPPARRQRPKDLPGPAVPEAAPGSPRRVRSNGS